MYEENGIIYADEKTEELKVTDVKHVYSGILMIKFSNNETRLFDTTELEGEVFEPLKEINVVCHPTLEHGCVTWLNGEIDCCPEYMYLHSYEYNTKDIVYAA